MTVNDQFAKAARPSINDRACSRVEGDFSDYYFASSPSLLLSQTYLRIFRFSETANRRCPLQLLHRGSTHCVCRCHEGLLNRLRDKHHPTSDVTGSKDMWRGCSQKLVN